MKINVSIVIEIISKIKILSSKLEKVKNRSPYENEDPRNEMRKFTRSSLLDLPQIISLKILENTIHS